MTFRESFKLMSKQAIRWFPGHMHKGIKQIQLKVRSADCLIEVHDARIPLSGRDFEFKQTILGGIKPHILVLNKRDLIEIREQRRIVSQLREEQQIENVIFTNCKNPLCQGVKRLLPLACKLIESSDRYNRTGEKDYSLMIIGIPNVGKSSLLNVLRNRNLRKKSTAEVGAIAGVTRSVMERAKICENPLMYMIDTPGILCPRIENDEMGMKLALIGCLPDHVVGEDRIADYLLYWLNKHRRFEYVCSMGLDKPSDDIAEVLFTCANKLGYKLRKKIPDGRIAVLPDFIRAAKHFITLFRKGHFGLLNLDMPLPDKEWVGMKRAVAE